MTILETLSSAKKFLRNAFYGDALSSPELDAEVLLAAVLKVSREHLFAHPHSTISPELQERFQEFIQMRSQGIPVFHLLKKKEFFGLEFFVDENVLTPRPETEILVERTLHFLEEFRESTILDVGTGSGCIILSLAKHLPGAHHFFGIDFSENALDVARENAVRLGETRVEFSRSNLLEDFSLSKSSKHPIVLVANLPYIPETDCLSSEVLNFDPHEALFSGKDGLDLYRELFLQLAGGIRTKKRERISFDVCFFEFHPPQQPIFHDFLTALFPSHGLDFTPDLSGSIRFGELRKRGLRKAQKD